MPNEKVIPISAEDWEAIADEFGDLASRLKPLKDRYEQLRDRILERYENLEPHKSATLDGTRYSIEISPREKVREIKDMKKVQKRLSLPVFLQECKITIGSLKKYIADLELTKYLTESRTGPRTLKPIPKQEADQAA